MASSDVDANLCFGKIMTSEVLFYDDAFEEECKMFCKRRNITYLPSKRDASLCYRLVGDEFKEEEIEESQKVDVKDCVFDSSVRKKFEKHHVLIVYREKEIAGIIHFCDYNRNPVSVYLYALLLEFERKLRELLISHGLNNKSMINFFEEHSGEELFSRKLKEFQKTKKQKEMEELEPFQAFDMRDLIGLLYSKGIYKVPVSINDDLRNAIMHAKNVVKHENYENSNLIYDFESFNHFFQLIGTLQSEIGKVSKEILPIKEDENLTRLKNAGLFLKL